MGLQSGQSPAGRASTLADHPRATFPKHNRSVAFVAQHLGDGHALLVEVALVGGQAPVLTHVPHPYPVLVKPGEQTGAGGATARGIVAVGEQHPFLGQLVKVRGCISLPVQPRSEKPMSSARMTMMLGCFWPNEQVAPIHRKLTKTIKDLFFIREISVTYA